MDQNLDGGIVLVAGWFLSSAPPPPPLPKKSRTHNATAQEYLTIIITYVSPTPSTTKTKQAARLRASRQCARGRGYLFWSKKQPPVARAAYYSAYS